MKKQIIILFLLIACKSSWSQNFVKTTSPCNDTLLQKTPGRLIHDKDLLYATTITKQQQQEILNRLDAIHQLVLKIYPTPVGIDAVWNRTTHDNNVFANQVKISYTPDGDGRQNPVNGIAVIDYNYRIGFFRYTCGREPNEIMTGWPIGENGIHAYVYVNSLYNFFNHNQLDPALREIMCINGRPIITMPIVKGKWKGYQLYYPETGSGERLVLLHREGILPYIPVTRKEYLDRCIDYIPKFYDPMIKGVESMPVRTLEEQEVEKNKVLDDYKKKYGSDPKKLKSAVDYYLSVYQTDQQQRDEQLKNVLKQKEDALKRYKDELQSTKEARLLDSPAIIPLEIFHIGDEQPIFVAEEAGGMLVTENPAYIRKDLPKYIPQFFVMKWETGDWKPYQDIYNAIEENFPIEKLQAMIDK